MVKNAKKGHRIPKFQMKMAPICFPCVKGRGQVSLKIDFPRLKCNSALAHTAHTSRSLHNRKAGIRAAEMKLSPEATHCHPYVFCHHIIFGKS